MSVPAAVVLLVCVPLIPVAIAAVQTWAKKLLSKQKKNLNAYSNNARCLQIFLSMLWMRQLNQSLYHNSVQMLV